MISGWTDGRCLDLSGTYSTTGMRFEAMIRRQAAHLAGRRAQTAELILRQTFRFRQPAYDNVSVQRQARSHSALHCRQRTSQRPDLSAVRIPFGMRTLPAQAPSDDTSGFLRTGPTLAIGRPRLVTVMAPPVRAISSGKARHLALNSVALTTRLFTSPAYRHPGRMTTFLKDSRAAT